jgi:hypothetical protein
MNYILTIPHFIQIFYVHPIHRAVQDERSIFWDVIGYVIVRKELIPVLNGYRYTTV